ncbi:YbaB/EbfC family nucleoid-associated protein [Patescibacteria group bacterium]|nr:YbaB/EbfC family nucleoid-associated protein [Patescibacteria group bacterium]
MFGKLKRKATAKAMGMSDKQVSEMESMQRQMADINLRYEKDGIVVKVTGDMKIDYLEIDGSEREDIKKAVNKAFKKVQLKMAQKMAGSFKGFGR